MTRLAIVCGLAAEAKIADSPAHLVIAAGGDAVRIEAALDAAGDLGAILSFGVAGGLRPGLAPGDIVVADSVRAPDGAVYETDGAWSQAIAGRLHSNGRPVATGKIAGAAAPLADRDGKAATFAATGAALVDMESYAAARWASRRHLRFAALRVITDPAQRSLPHAATVGMRADGSIDLPAILRSLARDPRQVPAIVRTGLDARTAFASLLRCRERLGPAFALFDL